MEIFCTRSGCSRPQNYFADLDDSATLKTIQQKYCTACGMPLILVGRYLPLKLLGKGGFGAAFLARDRYTPGMRRCVVKQFQPSGTLTQTQLQIAQQLFEREAEVLEELGNQHDQIPNLYAFFELTVPSLQPNRQDKFFYLVQEYIDGKNLEEELQEKGKFSASEVVALLQGILPVLQFIHEHGSIHRDIKPSNIMRHRNGRLYLLDFGAVKQVTTAVSIKGSTGIYSQGYAPPEQMSGGNVYPSTDLYALAVTAVILLTGKEPAELFDAYNNRWNWRTNANVPSAIADILDRMLLVTPNQRFQSASEVLSAIASATTPPPVSPPPPRTAKAVPYSNQPLSRQPTFSTLELVAGAGLSGFEGGLLGITIYELLNSLPITLAVTAFILGILIFAQTRRWLDIKDLLILIGVTLAIILFLPASPNGQTISSILLVALVTGAAAIAFTALFRLIYKLLSLIF
ncbi:serine/threonine-protein kinase [Gloeocapsopsis dulcis]|uniref:non-specific serine/threonine protein kinase n=1 Tax=Gloeocapsopsis dulcis AAB1 = 1H9 TaxID=1433147 RepID=A0A6N8FTQ6_9CHRO|nr:serine/threonine-protein kinase [Gloeocapsopsis dulcis]MUL36483.1 serine/threonine protein kinase [Gloeocapsopsis dulcis AAB1 = 1H9]WNN87769.1 serine/threonine-protein kinase [Gloeocapsopsis dulcis]